MPYPYEQIFAADESSPEKVASNGIVTIFAPGDPDRTPLTIATLDGLPLSNPIQVNDAGFGPAFMHETLDQVAWAGGGFSGLFVSYQGMKDEAVAARRAAEEAASNAAAPTDESVDQGIQRADIPGTVARVVASEINLTRTPAIEDAVGEWWIRPLATYQESPYPRTLFGAIAGNGDVLACEFNHATGKTVRTVVGSAVVDDHNVPSLIAELGRRPVLAWTNHNADHLVRIKVGSRTGEIGSLAVAEEVTVDLRTGASYTQFHFIPGASSQRFSRYWCFTRTGYNNWSLIALTVDERTGALNVVTTRTLINGEGRQCYLSTADAHSDDQQVIRCGFGFNPAQADSEIYYFEINTTTGAVSGTNAPTQNVVTGVGLPVSTQQMEPFVGPVNSSHDRRFFYTRPGPDVPAVAYADWPLSDPDAAVYTVKERRPAEPYKGLVPAPGRAQSDVLDGRGWADGFEFEVSLRLPTTLGTFSARVGLDNDPIMKFQINPDGSRTVRVKTDDAFVENTSSATPFASLGGRAVGLRMRVDFAEGRCRQYYTTDGGAAWVQIGDAGVNLPPASKRVATESSTGMVIQGSADVVTRAEIRNLGGSILHTLNFTDWPAHAPSYGAWRVYGGAYIAATVPTVTVSTFGASGPRINAEASNNYIAGMAFEDPSYDRAVITTHSHDGTERVRKHRATAAGYAVEQLREQPTSKGRLVRPYPPLNGGPIPVMLTEITRYQAFTDYRGNSVST